MDQKTQSKLIIYNSNDSSNPREPIPVFLSYYCPGHFPSVQYMIELGKAAKKYGDKAKFMFVNTKNNIEYARQKEYGNKILLMI